MIITVERLTLCDAVSNLSRAVSAKAAIPVLEGILLSAERGTLTMMAYNLEIGMTKVLPVNCKKEGDIVLNARLFLEILKRLKGDFIELEVDERLMCHIKCEASLFDIMGMAAEDFPEMPSVAEHNMVTLPAEMLKDMVRQTVFATSQNEGTRPVLTGINFEVKNDSIKLVAIDGSRLAIRKANIKNRSEMNFIVSGRAIGEAVKIINDENEDITIRVGKRHISFEIDGYFMISRLLEGDYIEYERSIPATNSQQIRINTREIIEIIERISLIINDQLKTPIRCILEQNKITFSCSSVVGRATDTYNTELSGSEFEIGFNSRYLLDALKATESDEVILKFNGGAAAALICPLDGDEFLYLVMPMKLK